MFPENLFFQSGDDLDRITGALKTAHTSSIDVDLPIDRINGQIEMISQQNDELEVAVALSATGPRAEKLVVKDDEYVEIKYDEDEGPVIHFKEIEFKDGSRLLLRVRLFFCNYFGCVNA